MTGARPTACAWWGFFDDDVAAVIRAHAWYEKNQGREWWGDDPEAWLVEAVGLYDRVLERCRADRAKRTPPSGPGVVIPPGWEVAGVTRG